MCEEREMSFDKCWDCSFVKKVFSSVEHWDHNNFFINMICRFSGDYMTIKECPYKEKTLSMERLNCDEK